MNRPVFQVIIITLCFILNQIEGYSENNPLILTPHIENGNASLARELSKVDPDILLGIESHSAFITVNKDYGSNLFFWYLPHPDVEKTPLIIWLNGGPGVTSLFGLFEQIGPIQIIDKKLQPRKITWANDFSLLFIDNPVGAGFSFTQKEEGYTTDEEQVIQHRGIAVSLLHTGRWDNNADTYFHYWAQHCSPILFFQRMEQTIGFVGSQLYEFIQQFLEVFPELREAPLYIAGESYAGKYVPAFAVQIHRHKDEGKPIKLKGISLGNAMIDIRYMMHYSSLMRELGLLEDEHVDELRAIEKQVVPLIDKKEFAEAAQKFNETIEYIKKKTSVNILNYLKDPSHLESPLEEYVTRPEIRKAIHVGNVSFDLNNQHVYKKMLADIANSSKPFVQELLEDYGVMCYTGQLDLLIPFSLSKRVFSKLQWSKRDEYINASRKRVYQDKEEHVVAFKKAGGNFVEILVRGSGHMVPNEKPEVAKFLIKSFVNAFK